MTKLCIICGKDFEPRNCKQLCCCKNCSQKYSKSAYYRNKEKRLQYQKTYALKNQERIKEYEKNKKIYHTKTCPICNKSFTTTKSIKVCCSNECNKIRKRKLTQEYLNNKYKNNINFKLTILIRTHFKRYFKQIYNYKKLYHTFDMLDYTVEQLKQRLEFQFKNGMTWDNYGTYWVIHHKKALHRFIFMKNDNIDYKQLKLANSLANLQPITIEEHKRIHHT